MNDVKHNIQWKKPVVFYFIVLLIISSMIRIFIAITSEPIVAVDTQSYIDFANQIHSGDMNNLNGGKPPGYPLFEPCA